MGESLLLITIITLVVLTIRRARPVVLETPVTIQRPGKYQITLAQQLNRAQPFIEEIANKFVQLHQSRGDFATRYFQVRDPKVFSKGENLYLLAISLRAGVLYFQAINPKPLQTDQTSHYETVHEFSETEMRQHPLSAPTDEVSAEKLCDSVKMIAEQFNISVISLQNSD